MNDCVGEKFILNGKIYPVQDYNEDLFQTGNVVYEVLRAEEGVPLFADDYLIRLQKTVQLSGIKAIADKDAILENILKLIKINSNRQGPVKLMLSDDQLLLYYMRPYLPEPHEYQTGVKTTLLHEERINPNAKIWNPSFREKVISALRQNQAYEVILVNQNGEITEGGRSNVFFVKKNELYTAPNKMVLPGITRMKVMDICNAERIALNEKVISYTDIAGFDSAFLTGTSRKVVPVKLIDDIKFSTSNALINRIAQKFDELVNNYIRSRLVMKRD